ncbi:outer membrane protein assembly factor BamB family protein [Microtetraspora niveoalba]|uniref:outer membrane protein assembly factor BamB family protein n=1 Tax=Microtetraspora niveoalba TaxID=46175 RepID=UPI00082E20C1|nr:PQQ-binding-like beta-propeller repeat protein [Microtetraspora niveoalba]
MVHIDTGGSPRAGRASAAVALCLALVAGCGTLSGRPGADGDPPEATGPHRVTAAPETPADAGDGTADSPETAAQRRVALRQAWQVTQVDEDPRHYALASDGTRVIALRREIGEASDADISGYDGADGKKLWTRRLQWVGSNTPVAAGQTVVIPSGGDSTADVKDPMEYVALDSATGAERWRVKVTQRALMRDNLSLPGPPAGAVLDGVFYYSDGPKLVGVDLVTGKVKYRRTSKTHLAVAGPVVAGDRIAVIVKPNPFTHNKGVQGNVRGLAILGKDLAPVHQLDFPKFAEVDEIVTSGDIVVAAQSGGSSARVWGIDAGAGKALWDWPLPDKQHVGLPVGGVLPLVDESVNHKPQFVGHDILTGKKLWTLAPRQSEEAVDGDRAMGVADGTLFGLGHGVEIVDTATGKAIFGQQFTPRGGGLVVAAAGRIVIYNHDGLMGFD